MKAIIIGPENSGKTTLCRCLAGLPPLERAVPTQMFRRIGSVYDTPGVYLATSDLYHALIVGAQQADIVLLTASPDCLPDCIPPGFAQCFPNPVYGILTKCDLPEPGRAEQILRSAGVPSEPLRVACRTGTGLAELKNWLAGAMPAR